RGPYHRERALSASIPPERHGGRTAWVERIETTCRGITVSVAQARSMKLAVGDVVVYGNHGTGVIAARKEQTILGTEHEVIVIHLEDDLPITLPLDLAREQLRPPAGRSDIQRIRKALREDSELGGDPWLSRRTASLEKLTSSNPVQLAELVSEGAQRERLRRTK